MKVMAKLNLNSAGYNASALIISIYGPFYIADDSKSMSYLSVLDQRAPCQNASIGLTMIRTTVLS